MNEMLRYATGSDIALFCERTPDGRITKFRKVALSAKACTYIANEKKGWDWYSRAHPSVGNVVSAYHHSPEKSYARIDLWALKGSKPNYRAGLLRNTGVISNLMDQYFSLWNHDGAASYPVHGDLSLDNLIITPNGLVVCDWEHFSRVPGPFGFDMLHLIFESLWFDYNGRRTFRDSLREAAGLIYRLYEQGRPNRDLQQRPLHTIRTFMRENSHLWGEQLNNYPCKFPVLTYSTTETSRIDRHLSQLVYR